MALSQATLVVQTYVCIGNSQVFILPVQNKIYKHCALIMVQEFTVTLLLVWHPFISPPGPMKAHESVSGCGVQGERTDERVPDQ
jgi:hypothetical protein